MATTTVVLFRIVIGAEESRFKGHPEVIAVFPEVPAERYGLEMVCYAHFGGHGSVEPYWLRGTRAATPEEYGPLKQELESIGYNLRVCDKITPEHRAAFMRAPLPS